MFLPLTCFCDVLRNFKSLVLMSMYRVLFCNMHDMHKKFSIKTLKVIKEGEVICYRTKYHPNYNYYCFTLSLHQLYQIATFIKYPFLLEIPCGSSCLMVTNVHYTNQRPNPYLSQKRI